jgi:hypothetical protein
VPASKPASAAPAIKAFLFFVIVLSKLLFEFVTCYTSPPLKCNREGRSNARNQLTTQDRKSFVLRTTWQSVGRMNLHSIATGMIRMPFEGFTKNQEKNGSASAASRRVETLITPLAGHKLERRGKLDCVVQGAVERAAHRVNSMHALDCCSGLFRRH